ncbi:MAG: hypothetical protein AAGA88_12230 [Pseudomonadota bacterium]
MFERTKNPIFRVSAGTATLAALIAALIAPAPEDLLTDTTNKTDPLYTIEQTVEPAAFSTTERNEADKKSVVRKVPVH